MSFAVTLHPFDERDLVAGLLPAVVRADGSEALLARLYTDPDAETLIRQWMPRMREAWEALRAGDGAPWAAVVDFAAGVLSGFLHPVYFLGDIGLSYWRGGGECPFRPYTRSMAILAARVPEIGAAVSEIPDGFAGPSSAGTFVAATDVMLLLRDIERRPGLFAGRLTHAGYDAPAVLAVLLEVLHYARERRLAVMELTDAVDPKQQLTLFPEGHLRGAWRGGLHPEARRRVDAALAGSHGG